MSKCIWIHINLNYLSGFITESVGWIVESEVTNIERYRGIYRVFMPLDNHGNPTTNSDDTYIKGKYKTEVFRYNSNTLAIQFISNTTIKNILPKLNELDVKLVPFVRGDSESVYFFFENDLSKLDQIFNFRKGGAKISPKSIRTTRLSRKRKR